jgi:STE24 endopeptidase
MINAAVMGITGRLRYVLLSDALLASMTPRQVEAVFAHEAGHVRHHHIPHFLMFALAAWVIIAALMEGLAMVAFRSPDVVSIEVIQAAGIIGTLVVWGVGFGWVSRRFERQADLFGARCAAPLNGECEFPCSVHRPPQLPKEELAQQEAIPARTAVQHDLNLQTLEENPEGKIEGRTPSSTLSDQAGRVCATGAAIFASALERVALLNGIPRDERSWRHSSIASRIRFLLSLAADPLRTARFERLVRTTQIAMLVVGLGGSLISLVYCRAVGTPALIRLQADEVPGAARHHPTGSSLSPALTHESAPPPTTRNARGSKVRSNVSLSSGSPSNFSRSGFGEISCT